MLKKDDSENVEEHIMLLKNNFDFDDFVYEWFELKNPQKKAKSKAI